MRSLPSRARGIAVGIGTLGALASSAAHAHPSPQVLRIVWRDAGDQRLFLLTNRGFVFSDDGGQHWHFLCPELPGVTSSETPDIVNLADGRLLVAASTGLKATTDNGCSWQSVGPAADVLIPSMDLAATMPNRIYVATYPRNSTASAGMGLSSIRASDDGAASWRVVLTNPDKEFVHSLRVPPSAPNELYVAGTVYDASARMQYVAHSSDSGANWTRSTVEVDQSEDYVRLLVVSPKHPEIVVAMVLAAEPQQTPERLLISHDGGKTFTSPLSTLWLTDANFSADGSTLWIASQDGLFRGEEPFDKFEHIGSTAYMSCAEEHAGKLFVCGRYEGIDGPAAKLNGIATSTDQGQSFASMMNLVDITTPLDCGAGSNAASVCDSTWQHWQGEVLGIGQFALGGDAGVRDAGARDAGGALGSGGGTASGASGNDSQAAAGSSQAGRAASSAGSGGQAAAPKKKAGSGCGCRVIAASPNTLVGYSSLLLALPLFRRRARKRG